MGKKAAAKKAAGPLSDLEELTCIIREEPGVSALRGMYGMHRDKNDPVDLDALLASAPPPHVEAFCGAVLACLPEVPAFGSATALSATEWDGLRIAGELTLIAQRALQDAATPQLRALGARLHDALPAAPARVYTVLLKALTPVLLADGADVAEHALPALLAHSFGDAGPDGDVRPPAVADVRRVFAAREQLSTLDLRASGPNVALRNLLLRCPSALLYLRVADGKKFLAFLLTLKHLSQGIFDALLQMLATVRKSQAISVGEVFLLAWRTKGADRFVATLINIVEKAIVASSEPLATNLRSVLSVFHRNRRLPRMEAMLHRVYGPTLQRNLMVANPLVRRNSITILCDAYPVHDPEASHGDIEGAIYSQTDKMISLLADPAPIVRSVTVQGVCRVLTLYVEVVPAAKSKKMIDLITSKLAFDSSCAAVRIAAFDGLRVMLSNHATHDLLKSTLPRLRPLIHDNVERVRLAFLDLLLQLKKRRIAGLTYFAVVPIEELLLRIPEDSPAVVSSIMELIVTSYFPTEKPGKTTKEIRQIQIRACRSMLQTNARAASSFYKQLHVYVPPGPLLTFVMSISSEGINVADKQQPLKQSQETAPKKQSKKTRTAKRTESKKKRTKLDASAANSKENEEDDDDSGATQTQPDANQLLAVAADVLQSISPALAKENNLKLRETVDDVYKPADLKPYLVKKKYACATRSAVWRIASCLSVSVSKSILAVWTEELRAVGDSLYGTKDAAEKGERLELLAALVSCGLAWGKTEVIDGVLGEWVGKIEDVTFAAEVSKLKKGKKTKGKKGKKNAPPFPDVEASPSKNQALSALIGVVDVLTKDAELKSQFLHTLESQMTPKNSRTGSASALKIVSSIRRGCLAAVDNLLASSDDDTDAALRSETKLLALLGLSATWKLLLVVLGSYKRGRPVEKDTSFTSVVSGEFNSLLDWSGNPGLFADGYAFSENDDLCASFSAVWLAHCNDAICLGYAPDSALLALEKFAEGVAETLAGSDSRNMLRVITELLRTAYQLGEHAVYVAAVAGADAGAEVSAPLTKVRDSVAKATLGLIASIRVDDDSSLNGTQPLLVQSLGELLGGFGGDMNSVTDEALKSALDSLGGKHQSLLAALLASVLRRHAMQSNRAWNPELGSTLLRSCFGSFVESNDATSAVRLVGFAAEYVFEDGVPLEGPRAVEGYSCVTETVRDLVNCVANLPSASDASVQDEVESTELAVKSMEARAERLRSGEEATPTKDGAESDDDT